MKDVYPTSEWVDPRIEIRPRSLAGRGMFACFPIRQGERMMVWGGHVFAAADVEAGRVAPGSTVYIGEGTFLGSPPGAYNRERDDRGDFINHSCDPNVWMQDENTLVARRDISAGEELTLDYALFEGDENDVKPWMCRCGSPRCRHKITGKDWRLAELQRRYEGHFSPFINERIRHQKEAMLVRSPARCGDFSVFTTVDRATDPAYIRYQYGTTEKLDIRIEAHQRYSERPDDYLDWVLDWLEPHPGDLALDVGCGRGSYHPLLTARGVRAILGVDASPAMVAATQRQADERQLPVVSIDGNAERLPVPDAAYDLGMANHVLFLIADQRAALRELRRVLKPSGRVVLTTNGEDHCERLAALHRAAAQRLGYQAFEPVMGRFHLGHLPLVREAFPTAQCCVREDAFLFPSTDAALRYYGSAMVDAIIDPPAGGEHRTQLLTLVGDQIDAIIRREGVFRVPKDSGCFVDRI